MLTHHQIASESEKCHSQYRLSSSGPENLNVIDSPTVRSAKTGQIPSGKHNQAIDLRNPVLPLDSPVDRDKIHHSQMKATSTDTEKLHNMDFLFVPTSSAEQVTTETSYQSYNQVRNPMVHYVKAANKATGLETTSVSPFLTCSSECCSLWALGC